MAGMQGVDWAKDAPAGRAVQASLGEGPRRRSRGVRPARAIFGLLAATALASAFACVVAAHLIWNRTPSLPLGLYMRTPGVRVRDGALVALPVPPAVRPLVDDRRYLPDGSLLIKPVAAVPGDFVCARRGILFINGEPFGRILARDSQNRELPAFQGCGVLPEGQVFLASHHPQSFDSRSFGPVDVHALQGTVTPLWTF
jgi:conjugative transfer signal peptidase TraF